jgi:hypothetical protein
MNVQVLVAQYPLRFTVQRELLAVDHRADFPFANEVIEKIVVKPQVRALFGDLSKGGGRQT